jgi:hypothetical protein
MAAGGIVDALSGHYSAALVATITAVLVMGPPAKTDSGDPVERFSRLASVGGLMDLSGAP